MALEKTGLLKEWENWFAYSRPQPTKCLEYNHHAKQLQRLSLLLLSSAFLVLITSCSLAFVAFVFEKLHFRLLSMASRPKPKTRRLC